MIVFAFLSVAVVISAAMVLRSAKLTYAALWLAGTLVAVAGIFLSLGAEFLAAMQVLIYAGAVITLMLFAIMFASEGEFSNPSPRSPQPSTLQGEGNGEGQGAKRANLQSLLLVVAFLSLLLVAVLGPSVWQTAPTGWETFRAIGETLFGSHLLAFEILSLLLLAALIGAVFLARRSP